MNAMDAKWVANRLNSGKMLCIAVSNLLENTTWSKNESAAMIEDALDALRAYKRESE
jgi:hypothetical protein